MIIRRFLAVLLLTAFATLLPGRFAGAETLSASDQAIYRTAFKLIEKGKWDDARALALTARNPLPAKVIQWLDLIRPGTGRSFDEISAFMQANPAWPYQITLQSMAERNMPDNMSPREVQAWFTNRTPQTAYGAAALARALIQQGRGANAADILRTAWREENFDRDQDEEAFYAEFSSYLRPADNLARLDRVLWNHDETSARQVMPLVDDGHRALAEARIALWQNDHSAPALVDQVPTALQRDAGLVYELARSRRKLQDYQGAAAILNPPPVNIGRPDLLWPELADAARRSVQRGDMTAGYSIANGFGATEGATFAEGEWLSGWIALRALADYKIAYEHFTTLYAGVGTTISKARGAYWAGRAAEEMGDMATAQNWYRAAATNNSAYYGQLAAARLGSSDALVFAPMPQPTAAEIAAFNKRELVRVVRLLGQLDQDDRTRAFLKSMADTSTNPASLRMIADLGWELHRDDLAVMVAKIARDKGVDLIEYLYPLRSVPQGPGPEPALTLAIIRQESAFEVDAVSPAGALGLMQLMPATAKHVAKGMSLRYRKEDLTRSPDYNMLLGRAYLQELLDNFSGSYVLAIAAYNAGPDRVNSWMSLYGDPRDRGVDVVDWIETIPIYETRNYVQRVLENLQVYRHRLGVVQVAQSLQQDLIRRSSP
ncbi:MAG TPA: lytic transglycosylase domain-containing protein [Dongiaceae bacterium]|nr:lytic transglycosylase domain-containing protein [Dongiaceae bacterium]